MKVSHAAVKSFDRRGVSCKNARTVQFSVLLFSLYFVRDRRPRGLAAFSRRRRRRDVSATARLRARILRSILRRRPPALDDRPNQPAARSSRVLPFRYFFLLVTSISRPAAVGRCLWRALAEGRRMRDARQTRLCSSRKERVNYNAERTDVVATKLDSSKRPPAVIRPLMPTYNSPISQCPSPRVMNVTRTQIYEHRNTHTRRQMNSRRWVGSEL